MSTKYRYQGTETSDTTAAVDGFAITPNDGADQPEITRAIYVGVGGTIAVWMRFNATPLTFINVPSGTILPVKVIRVLATGTTATNLIGLV
jgi:hypothetical protein